MTNAEIDAAVLDALQAHPDGMRFNEIYTDLCPAQEPTKLGYRDVDKSLQRLRRAEKAKWTADKGWVAS